MPKPIKLTQDWIQQMVKEFTSALGKIKLSDGKVSYTKSITYDGKDKEKATIYFEPVAYAKMLMLIHTFSDEVAWHGTVDRANDKTFIIKDLFVYPQEVTGGTVTTDQERYQQWLMDMDDEVFNKLHMQGHSHVNFATTPSAVDRTFYDSILAQLADDGYYIFMVFNKRLERTAMIYDMANNILYEDSDIDIGIMCDDGDLEQFVADAKELVVKKAAAYGTGYGTGYGGNYGTGYGGNYGTGYGGKGGTKVTDFSEGAKKKASAGSKKSKIPQSPGNYGGYGQSLASGLVDYDAEIFDRRPDYSQRADWWND